MARRLSVPLWEIKTKFGSTRGWFVFVERLSCSLSVIMGPTLFSSSFWLCFRDYVAPVFHCMGDSGVSPIPSQQNF